MESEKLKVVNKKIRVMCYKELLWELSGDHLQVSHFLCFLFHP